MKLDPSLFETAYRIFEIRAEGDAFEEWALQSLDAPTLSTHQRRDPNGFFLIAAKHISSDGTLSKAFLDVVMPERVIDSCYTLVNDRVVQTYRWHDEMIPAVAIESFGNYEDFYSKRFPEIGLDVLREGLVAASLKWPIAMELGYILRDERRPKEAIHAFSIALDSECPLAMAYLERAQMYQMPGENASAEADLRSFDSIASPAEKRSFGRT